MYYFTKQFFSRCDKECVICPSADFVVPRHEKHGGTVTFPDYPSLEQAFAKQEIFPLDLKNAVSIELNKVKIGGDNI